MRFDNSGYTDNNFGSNDAEPDDDARDEAFNDRHPCCETCQGLLCIDPACDCGFDEGLHDVEASTVHCAIYVHKASASCRAVMATRAATAAILMGVGR